MPYTGDTSGGLEIDQPVETSRAAYGPANSPRTRQAVKLPTGGRAPEEVWRQMTAEAEALRRTGRVDDVMGNTKVVNAINRGLLDNAGIDWQSHIGANKLADMTGFDDASAEPVKQALQSARAPSQTEIAPDDPRLKTRAAAASKPHHLAGFDDQSLALSSRRIGSWSRDARQPSRLGHPDQSGATRVAQKSNGQGVVPPPARQGPTSNEQAWNHVDEILRNFPEAYAKLAPDLRERAWAHLPKTQRFDHIRNRLARAYREMGVPNPVTRANLEVNAWPTSPISEEFRNEIHKRESQLNNRNYRTDSSSASGRYQMTKIGLLDAGMLDKQERWTGKYGIHSKEDFLNNPVAQEKAFVDLMTKKQTYVRNRNLHKYYGQEIDGIKARIEITRPGVLAASHREGSGNVRRYLRHREAHNWKSDPSTFPLTPVPGNRTLKDVFLSVETRLREFQNIPFDAF